LLLLLLLMMMMMMMMTMVVRKVILLFRDIENSLRFSDVLKQGIKLLIYMLLACHLGACWLHVIACFDTYVQNITIVPLLFL